MSRNGHEHIKHNANFTPAQNSPWVETEDLCQNFGDYKMSKHAFPEIKRQVREQFNDERSRHKLSTAERLMIPFNQYIQVIEDTKNITLDVSRNGMYLDKIMAPDELVEKVSGYSQKSDMASLSCPNCKTLMAVPMVYDKENRLAYRIVDGGLEKR